MKKVNIQYIISLVLTFSGLVALLSNLQETSAAARNGIELCLKTIIPSIFPFLVFSSLIVSLGFAEKIGTFFKKIMRPLFNIPEECSIALFLGFISGFPVGAKTAVNLYERGLCTKSEAERLLTFTNNPSSGFILGTIGNNIWASNSIGWFLWLIQTISALIIGIVFGSRWKKNFKTENIEFVMKHSKEKKMILFSKALTDSIKSSAISMLNICAFVIFFAIVIELFSGSAFYQGVTGFLSNIFSKSFMRDIYEPLISGFLEMTNGIYLINKEADFTQNMTLIAWILGWSGLSVHCQVMSFLYEGGLSPKPYILSKILQSLVSAILTFLLTVILF